jgi:multidrug efflux pump subunit AcrA (membrane-fusion protein)
MFGRQLTLGGTASRLLVVAAAALAVGARAEPTGGEKLVVGLTLPSDGHPRELKFEAQGTIKSVEVKPGEHVKAGQVVMKQDDRKEVAELKGLQADVTEIGIKQAKTQAVKAHADLKRLEAIHAEAQNDAEVEKAKAEAEYYDLQISKEEADLEVKKHKVERQLAVVDMMQLRSPVDGYVLAIDSQTGETADPQKPAIKIVANDPLQVQLVLSTAMSQKLKLGRKIRVSYDRKQWSDAEVSYVSPQALGVGTQKVWLRLANPEARDSGLKITVELPEDVASAKELPVGADIDATAGARIEGDPSVK